MNATELFANMECMTEVTGAACVYDDQVRSVRVRQSFYIAPDDTIYSLQAADGSYTVLTLRDDDEVIFRSRHQEYFGAH